MCVSVIYFIFIAAQLLFVNHRSMYNFICNLNFFIRTALYSHCPYGGLIKVKQCEETRNISLMSIIRCSDLSRRKASSVLERFLVPSIIAQVDQDSLSWIQFTNDFGFKLLFLNWFCSYRRNHIFIIGALFVHWHFRY